MPNIGYKQTREHRMKLRVANAGRVRSESTRRKLCAVRSRRELKRVCKRGHDTLILGRKKGGGCRACLSNATWKKSGVLNPDGSPFTVESLHNALSVQRGLCAICGDGKSLRVDHSHKTGVFRGLLCNVCNKTLGHYEKIKSSAEKYLVGIHVPFALLA